jgi:hypothetical protein
MGEERRRARGLALGMAVHAALGVIATVGLWRGGHNWQVEWLLWVALGVSFGGVLGFAGRLSRTG